MHYFWRHAPKRSHVYMPIGSPQPHAVTRVQSSLPRRHVYMSPSSAYCVTKPVPSCSDPDLVDRAAHSLPNPKTETQAHIFTCAFAIEFARPHAALSTKSPAPMETKRSTKSQKSQLSGFAPFLPTSQFPPNFVLAHFSTDCDILYINIKCSSSSSHSTLNLFSSSKSHLP